MYAVQGIAVRIPPHLDAHDALPRLDPLPEGVIDDPQMRDLGDLPAALRVDARDLLAGLGVLHVGAAVPLHSPDIERVVEKPGAAIELPADGRVAPGPAARARNAFIVELLGDRARRVAIGKGVK